MNEETGEIKDLLELEKLSKKERAKYVPVPDDQIEKVRGMNRAERRAWARKQRKAKK